MKSFEMAKTHFDRLRASTEGQEELLKMNALIQFDLKDDEPFYIDIKEGKVLMTKGKAPAESGNLITLTLDSATVTEIFQKGQLYPGLADFMFAGKLWFKGSGSTRSWAAKLLRMHA